jgi:predicted Zn-dependent peptidase
VGSGLSAFRDAGLLSVYAGCSNTRVDEVVRVIMDELRGVVRGGIDEAELVRAKDNVKGSLILGLESTWQRAAYLARQEIYFDEPFTIEDTLAGIDAVTIGDVARVASDLLTRTPVSVAVVGDVNGFAVSGSELQVAS